MVMISAYSGFFDKIKSYIVLRYLVWTVKRFGDAVFIIRIRRSCISYKIR